MKLQKTYPDRFVVNWWCAVKARKSSQGWIFLRFDGGNSGTFLTLQGSKR